MHWQASFDVADPARVAISDGRRDKSLDRLDGDRKPTTSRIAPAPDAEPRPAESDGYRLRDGLVQAMDEAIVWLGADGRQRHRGIHLARKALRRARAALQLAGPAMADAAREIDVAIKHECRRLSAARDAQACLETLQHVCKRLGPDYPDAALACARRTLTHRRAAAVRSLLRRDPGLQAMRRHLIETRDAALRLRWADVEADAIGRALERSARRADKAARTALHSNSEKRRHRWRRRLRHWSSQLALLGIDRAAPVNAPPVAADAAQSDLLRFKPRSAKKIAALAHRLGREHDLRVLAAAIADVDALDAVPRRELLRRIRTELRDLVRRCRA